MLYVYLTFQGSGVGGRSQQHQQGRQQKQRHAAPAAHASSETHGPSRRRAGKQYAAHWGRGMGANGFGDFNGGECLVEETKSLSYLVQ